MWTVVAAVLVWVAIGLLACVGFRRAGHNFWLFAGLAVWMGPFILVVMRLVARDQEPSVVRVLRQGSPSDGWLDLLVGIDGSPESSASVSSAVRTFAPAIRRLRFVAVLDHETAGSPDFFDTDEEIEDALNSTAAALDGFDAELALLSGRADRALVAHAEDEAFDLLLVSHRNHVQISTLLGSTVQRLSRQARIPVLLGPPVDGEQLLEQQPTAPAAIGD